MSNTLTEKPVGSTAPSLLKAAGLIAVVTVFPKFLGAVRDWAIFNVYGASGATDAYFAAVQIPWFAIVLLGGLGGPFHTATVGIFSKLIKDTQAPDDRAKQLASAFMTLTGLVFAILSLLVYLFAEPIMGFLLPSGRPELLAASAEQLRVMSPVVLLGGLIGIFYGLLNVYHVFFWPSLSPAAMSIVIILALWLFPDQQNGQSGMILAWATTLGAFGQLIIQIPDYIRRKFPLFPAINISGALKFPEMRQLGEVLFPIIIGTTIGQLMVYVDMFFASKLVEGGWAAVVLSNRLIQLPIGVLQTALLVPIFPRFSRYVGEANTEGLRNDFRKGIVSLWMISVPMLVVILLFTEPLIRLVFEHGSFDAEDTALVTIALVFQSLQILPYFVRDTITRVFYAHNDSITPMTVGFVAIGIKYLLNMLLIEQFGIGGITLATSLITLINMMLLGWLSRRHIADMGYAKLLGPLIKLCFSGALMAVSIWLIQPMLAAVMNQSMASLDEQIAEFCRIAALIAIGMSLYVGITLLLKIPEADYLFTRVKSLLRR